MNLTIRPYQKSDLPILYEICLKTGDSGKDATAIYQNPLLLGHFYAAPYAVFHPELTFVLTKDNVPIGYVIGTDNTKKLIEETEKGWFVPMRQKFPLPKVSDNSPDTRIIRLIHQGHQTKKELSDYPAHLHIDILPEGQGQGMGKKLISTFCNKLIEINVKALHIEVGKKNESAMKFYANIGFQIIHEYEHSVAYGMIL